MFGNYLLMIQGRLELAGGGLEIDFGLSLSLAEEHTVGCEPPGVHDN